MKDLQNKEIKLGDRIAFGGRCGHHGYMAVGDVKKIGERTITVDLVRHSEYGLSNGENVNLIGDGLVTVVQRPERCVVVSR